MPPHLRRGVPGLSSVTPDARAAALCPARAGGSSGLTVAGSSVRRPGRTAHIRCVGPVYPARPTVLLTGISRSAKGCHVHATPAVVAASVLAVTRLELLVAAPEVPVDVPADADLVRDLAWTRPRSGRSRTARVPLRHVGARRGPARPAAPSPTSRRTSWTSRPSHAARRPLRLAGRRVGQPEPDHGAALGRGLHPQPAAGDRGPVAHARHAEVAGLVADVVGRQPAAVVGDPHLDAAVEAADLDRRLAWRRRACGR